MIVPARSLPGSLVTLVFFVACGGTVIGTDGGSSTDAASGSDTPMCTYAETRTSADRTCMTANDCTVVIRSVTCCMEQHEGIRKDVAPRFDSEQSAMTKGCPGCGCAAQPIDDLGMKGIDFTVSCDMSVCTSHAK